MSVDALSVSAYFDFNFFSTYSDTAMRVSVQRLADLVLVTDGAICPEVLVGIQMEVRRMAGSLSIELVVKGVQLRR